MNTPDKNKLRIHVLCLTFLSVLACDSTQIIGNEIPSEMTAESLPTAEASSPVEELAVTSYQPVAPIEIVVQPEISFQEVSYLLLDRGVYGDQGALWGDFNNDYKPDIIYMGHGFIPAFYKSEGGVFVNVAESSGIKLDDWVYEQQRDRHGASCADYDNDGNQDLFIGHGAKVGETIGIKYDELLRGAGDFTFTEESFSTGVLNREGRSRSGIWADINNDGWLDLHISNYQTPDVMYLSNQDGTFSEAGAELGLDSEPFRAAFNDFNEDGLVDVIKTSPMTLLRNTPDGVFEDVTQEFLGNTGLFAWGVSWGDFDNDADQDMIVSRFGVEGWLFENRQTEFVRHAFPNMGISPVGIVTGIAPGDFDNDGDLDIVLNTSVGIMVYQNEGGRRFTLAHLLSRPTVVDVKHGDITLEDFDGDGLLDVASDDADGYRLFRNTTNNPGNWVRLQFQGTRNNAMGFGNKISITDSVGNVLSSSQYFGSTGGLQSHGCALFQAGIGSLTEVNIEVQWPNGDVTFVEQANINQQILITDAGSAERTDNGTVENRW